MNRPETEAIIRAQIAGLLSILQRNNNAENIRESLFFSGGGNNIIKVMTYSERDQLEAPVKLLLGQKAISEKLSEAYVNKKYFECLHNILGDAAKVDEYLKDFMGLIFDSEFNKFFVISEIENIHIRDDSRYEFADSVIKILKEDDLPFEITRIGKLPSGITLIGKPAIFSWVKAGEIEKAKEYSLFNFMVSLNILRLYAPNFRPFLKGLIFSANQELVIYQEPDKIVTVSLSRVGDLPLENAYLNKELYAKLKDAGIVELNRDCSISKIVKECLYWFGLGLDEKHPSARLLNFVTVLEATLKKKNESTELRRTVSERGALLLCDDFKKRKEAYKQLKEIYDARSKVVHTGVLMDDMDLASLAGGYARSVLINLIKKSKEMDGNFEEFINHIDDIKLGKDKNA